MILTNEFIGANILVVDSNSLDRINFINLLKTDSKVDSIINEAASHDEALELFALNSYSHVFVGCNIALQTPDKLDSMKLELNSEAILIMIATPLNERYAADSLVQGFHDYLIKDASLTFNSLLKTTARAKQVLKLEAELKATSIALSSRNEFLSIAAHEFKTPLTAAKLKFQMGLKVLEKHNKKNELNFDGKDSIIKLFKDGDLQINRLTKLVDNLLDLSRLETGHLNLHHREMDLVELINEVYERFSLQLNFAHCVGTFELPASLNGFWDRERLDQVISNLFSNILRYAPNKPFFIKAYSDSKSAFLIVEDQGSGIPSEFHEKIFERYERIDNHGKNGLGLGLYITRAIITAHGGHIHVENAESGGARFVVTLPLNRN